MTLRFDCPQGCGDKLEVNPPKFDGLMLEEHMRELELRLGQLVINTVLWHALFECGYAPSRDDRTFDGTFHRDDHAFHHPAPESEMRRQ